MTGMEIDVKSKEWTGKLPASCRSVCVQWLDDGVWKPTGAKAPRPRGHAISMIEKLIGEGKALKYEKYRVVPASGDGAGDDQTLEGDEEIAMATKEKKVKEPKVKKEKVAKAEVELVAGRFRPGSILAKMYELLKDGVARTPEAIAKVVKPNSVANLTKGRFRQLRKWGNRSEMYSAVITDEGKIQLLKFSKETKKAEKVKEPVTKEVKEPEAKEPKAEKKAAKKSENGKSEKKAAEPKAPAVKKEKKGPVVEA